MYRGGATASKGAACAWQGAPEAALSHAVLSRFSRFHVAGGGLGGASFCPCDAMFLVVGAERNGGMTCARRCDRGTHVRSPDVCRSRARPHGLCAARSHGPWGASLCVRTVGPVACVHDCAGCRAQWGLATPRGRVRVQGRQEGGRTQRERRATGDGRRRGNTAPVRQGARVTSQV